MPPDFVDAMDRVEFEAAHIAVEELSTGATFDLDAWTWVEPKRD